MNKDVTTFLSLSNGSIAYVTHNRRLTTVHKGNLRLRSSLGNRRYLGITTFATRRFRNGTSIVFIYIGNCSMSSVARLVGHTSRRHAIMVPVLGICKANPHVRQLIPNIAILSNYVCVMKFMSKQKRVARVKGVFQLICKTRHDAVISHRALRTIRHSLRRDNVGTSVSSSVSQSAFIG